MKRLSFALFLAIAACAGANGLENTASAPSAGNAPSAGPRAEDPAEVAAKAAATERAHELVNDAKEAFKKANIDEAIKLLQAAIEENSADGVAHAWLGKAYTLKEKFSEAKLSHLRASGLTTSAKDKTEQLYLAAAAAYRLAQMANQRGDFKPAEEQARDALKYRESYPEARMALADALFGRKQYADARAQYQRAADESSGTTRSSGLYWVGQCFLRVKDEAAAEKVFSGLINEGYTENEVFAWRALCRFNRKDYKGARADFVQAIERTTATEKRREYQDALSEIDKLEKG